MAYTHYCCRSGGDNRNAGTLDGTAVEPTTAPFREYISGDWVASTRVFTLAGADFPADGIQVGMFASVYANGSTFTGFVGRISAVTTTTITIHATAFGGVAPTDGTANRSIRIGGSWLGPDGPATEGVPFTLATLRNARNLADFPIRINMKNDRTYTINSPGINSTIGAAFTNPTYLWGYRSVFGDSGLARFQGQAVASGYVMLNAIVYGVQLEFTQNGNTSTTVCANGFLWTRRCRVFNARGGFGSGRFLECLAENVAGTGFIANTLPHVCYCSAFNCGVGFNVQANDSFLVNCIAANCIGSGFSIGSNAFQHHTMLNCDSFNNGGNGFYFTNQFGWLVARNCNAVRNSLFGLQVQGASDTSVYQISNFGFGSGTEANGSGSWSLPSTTPSIDPGSFITYPANTTPWIDPVNRDFGLNLDVARTGGYGSFFEAATYGQPGIGSSQRVGSIGSSPSISAWGF